MITVYREADIGKCREGNLEAVKNLNLLSSHHSFKVLVSEHIKLYRSTTPWLNPINRTNKKCLEVRETPKSLPHRVQRK